MRFKQLIVDDDAVSPVIGVILMVAITVILAAVIGTFVLGLGESVQNTPPQASFDFSQNSVTYTDDEGTPPETLTVPVVTITHKGGDTLEQGQISVTVNGETAYGIDNDAGADDDSDGEFADQPNLIWNDGTGDIVAGDSIEVAMYLDTSGATVTAPTASMDLTYGSGIGAESASPTVKAVSSGDTVRVVWTSDSGDTSSTLSQYEIN